MNFVSDARLAIACNRAGIVPSLVGNDKITEQLKEFRDSCPSGNLILAIEPHRILMHSITLFKKYGVSHIQLLDHPNLNTLKSLKRVTNIKIIHKSLSSMDLSEIEPFLDAVDLKSPDAASRVVTTGQTTMERFLEQKATNPNLPIIVTGGISTSEQIKMYLEAGAEAVGLGTIFALSEESRIHPDKKLEMIKKSFSDVMSIGKNRMNGIVFSETPDTDNNHSDGLRLGRDTKDQGVIWAGKALNNITAIESVQTIVDRLIKDL
jgi:hypothetical protein